MRIYIVLLLIISINAYGQIHGDSLIKYSYTYLGIGGKGNQGAFGTCFFIKSNNELFLITAKHNLYECDSTTNIVKPMFTTGLVMLPDNIHNSITFKIAENPHPCLSMDRDTDLAVIKINPYYLKHINSVEQFITPPVKNPGDIRIYGQGMRNDSFVGIDTQHRINIPKDSYTFYSNTPTEDTTYIDSVHNLIESRNVDLDRWAKGFSGSPVFIQDTIYKNWRLCGMFIIVFPKSKNNYSGFVIVKPDDMLNRIRKYQ